MTHTVNEVNILLVDDKSENLLALENVLRKPEIIIFKASSGKEALEKLLERPYACVLLDVQMPDMDGFEVARLMSDNEDIKFTPILFVTAYGEDAGVMVRGYEEGAVDFLFKPLEPAVVRGKVQVFAELWRRRSLIEAQKEELAALNRQLYESNKDLETFVHIASHDLKEPLRSVSTLCQLLARRLKSSLQEDDTRLMTEIISGTKRMDALITDLLSYSKLRGESASRDIANVSKVVEEIKEGLKLLIQSSTAQVTCDEIPALRMNETHLSQVLQNLIANAIHYRRKDIAPQVHVFAKRSGKMVTVSVRDNGIGIEEKYFGKIFELFQRLNRDPGFPGTGLGLAICKRIIERQGGKIWVESKLNEGTVFSFTVEAC